MKSSCNHFTNHLKHLQTFYKYFTLTLSIVLTLFVGLSHVPHTCKHMQYAQYMQTHPAETALHTATNKQQNLTHTQNGY